MLQIRSQTEGAKGSPAIDLRDARSLLRPLLGENVSDKGSLFLPICNGLLGLEEEDRDAARSIGLLPLVDYLKTSSGTVFLTAVATTLFQ